MSIYNMLYEWQKKVVDKFKDRDSFGLFLTMGLGKTPVSLAFAEQNKCTKVIVITINSKALETINDRGSWLDWGSKSDCKYVLKSKTEASNFSKECNELVVINYESLFARGKKVNSRMDLKDNIVEFINSCKGHNVAIIVDESHKIKNLQSKQTLAITRIKRDLKFRANHVYTYLLTGTPFTTGYIDLYSQLKLLGCNMTKGDFIDRFCVRGQIPGLLGWQQPIVGYKDLNALYELIHNYAITIKSEDVVDLPPKIFIDHTTSISNEFKLFVSETAPGNAILDYAETRGKLTYQQTVELSTSKKLNNPYYRDIAFDFTKEYGSSKWLAETTGTFWLRARQLSSGFIGNAEESEWFDKRRLAQLKQFLSDNEDNYLLFYNFTPELLEIYDICTDLGYNVDIYCGECKSLFFYDKYSHQTEEQRLSNHKNIILANFASGSTGMNWQLYNNCIIFSTPLFKDYAQGIARISRLGQNKTTFYHVFYQENWLDESMRKSLSQADDYNEKMFLSDLARVKSMF